MRIWHGMTGVGMRRERLEALESCPAHPRQENVLERLRGWWLARSD